MGFLGFGNYAKPGKGVRKDAPKKKRFFQFFEIVGRKFFNLIKLNLLFLLYCLPAFVTPFFVNRMDQSVLWVLPCIPLCITIGPAMAAMTKICRYYTEEKPVFLWSDFFEAFKSNFKQAWPVGIINILLIILMSYSFIFYFGKSTENWAYLIPLGLVLMVGLIAIFANYYIYLMLVSVNLKLTQMIKNSVLLAFVGMKTNFITLFFSALIVIPSLLFFPFTLPLFLLLEFSFLTLMTVFNSWQYIYLYMVRPYYIQTGEKDPYETDDDETEEAIFTDMTGKED